MENEGRISSFFVEGLFDISLEIFRDGMIMIHEVSVDLTRRVVS